MLSAEQFWGAIYDNNPAFDTGASATGCNGGGGGTGGNCTISVSGSSGASPQTPLIVGQIAERIPGVRWELFEESSHMPHVEEPERFLEVVEGFLRTID